MPHVEQTRLPKEISPCPIREAIAEVRFTSTVPSDAVFGIAYQSLKAEFPKVEELPILNLPPVVRDKDQSLLHSPHYRLVGGNFVVLLGPRVISVGMLADSDYPRWPALSARIKAVIQLFNTTGVVGALLRFGLRYINFFPYDVFPQLRLRIMVDGHSWDGEETTFKTVLAHNSCKAMVRVQKGVALVRKPDQSGSVIDIDAFTTKVQGDLQQLSEFLETAHQYEKSLFFQLLTKDFLDTLNPVYDK